MVNISWIYQYFHFNQLPSQKSVYIIPIGRMFISLQIYQVFPGTVFHAEGFLEKNEKNHAILEKLIYTKHLI